MEMDFSDLASGRSWRPERVRI